jgi:hypothetical protein
LPDAISYFPKLSALSPAISLNGELSYEIDPWSFFGVDRAIDATPFGIVFLKRASESDAPICHASDCGEEETMQALLEGIEEQPETSAEQKRARQALMQQICRLPSLRALFSGEPEVIAADLDEILKEQFHV